MESANVRNRVREALVAARRRAADRREKNTAAMAAWARHLPERIVPLLHQIAQALRAEGHLWQVHTPGEAARLVSERSAEDYIELSLDTTADRPAVVATLSRTRGRSVVVDEHHLRDAAALEEYSEVEIVDDVMRLLAPSLDR